MSSRLRDVTLVVMLAAVAAAVSWHHAIRVDEALDVQGPSPGGHDDVWFDADVRDLHRRLTFDNYQQSHTIRHPLIALIARLPLRVYLRTFPASNNVVVVRGAIAIVAAVWAGLFFVTLRIVGCRRLDASLFTVIGLSSAAATFWFTVPETFPPGAITILPALVLVAMAERRDVPEWLASVVTALTLSVTATNGMFGAAATWLTQPWRRFPQIVSNGLCLVLVLWGVQRFIYPSSGFPYIYEASSYRGFFFAADTRTPLGPAAVFFVHGIVMPSVEAIHRASQENYPVLSVQRAGLGAATAAGWIALASWLGLLAAGVWSVVAGYSSRRIGVWLLVTLTGQLALHLVFGEETFLYAMHFTPILIVVSALGTLSPWRRPILACAGVLVVALLVNNLAQLTVAIAIARDITMRITP